MALAAEEEDVVMHASSRISKPMRRGSLRDLLFVGAVHE
jgi:hypothetical protein